MKVNLDDFKLTCLRCGHKWSPKIEDVRICPSCKSPYWDREKETDMKKSDAEQG